VGTTSGVDTGAHHDDYALAIAHADHLKILCFLCFLGFFWHLAGPFPAPSWVPHRHLIENVDIWRALRDHPRRHAGMQRERAVEAWK
jgi:hypothetical protein